MNTIEDAIEKVEWYNNRWKIEVFHKILKSGLNSESVRLRTAEGLMKIISIFCILSWRIFWMTMINRITTNASPKLILTQEEIDFIDTVDCKVNETEGTENEVNGTLDENLIGNRTTKHEASLNHSEELQRTSMKRKLDDSDEENLKDFPVKVNLKNTLFSYIED